MRSRSAPASTQAKLTALARRATRSIVEREPFAAGEARRQTDENGRDAARGGRPFEPVDQEPQRSQVQVGPRLRPHTTVTAFDPCGQTKPVSCQS